MASAFAVLRVMVRLYLLVLHSARDKPARNITFEKPQVLYFSCPRKFTMLLRKVTLSQS